MKRQTLLLCILCIAQLLQAQNRLETALQEFENDPALEYASISFSAIDIDKNELILSKNPKLSLPTASTMKAITTGTTLALLGPEFKFETRLEYDGEIVNGVLKGNLYIYGMGDPSLASPYMDGVLPLEQLAAKFVAAVKDAGIKRIEGAVIGDGSYYEVASVIPTWQWMDMGNHFGAGVTGLNLHDNLYFLSFYQNPKLDGKPSIKEVSPKVPNLRFYNELKSAAKNTGDNAYIYAAPYGEEAWIRGTIPLGNGTFRIKGAVLDPELFAAEWLRTELIARGVSVSRNAQAQRRFQGSKSRKCFHHHYSPPLKDIILHTNERSRNLYCESFLKTLGLKFKKEATTEAGTAVVLDFWKKRGIDTKGFFMQDGSGLSARNGVPSMVMAQIMRKMYIDKDAFPDFYNLLAVAGKTGTFKSLGKRTSLENNLHGKGGSMNRIRSYTGYIKTKGGRNVAFAIIVNNYDCSGYAIRKKLEKVLLGISELRE
jgi:D-alanyl-D-alanine carboxypeptidase/D-alanyl-D-alanine-endopeptidase (penicillin-binding protein 4)